MIHEDDIDRGSADGTGNRRRADRHHIRNREAKARHNLAQVTGDNGTEASIAFGDTPSRD